MELKMIAVDEIQPNPFQPRESFEKESLRELADSIRDASVIQPIVVRRHGKGYQIIAGERHGEPRRWLVSKRFPLSSKTFLREGFFLNLLSKISIEKI